ncbi:hypothetical protein PHYSODRAFT_326621 [Phytophthora sojae]|uniref:Uncharacterized protein n=1 Tax=Phytophthora sojae (strain P6497) TaxID=1094619 RepID=G4YX63_PHYSP|nr:hypothetical protein PHYSODRAFT_326621 [Phytophthora sojae]EGZ25631.1 hypothetical protein PHYSODRAFT_326621 [Phytophthora sojae]|eukprot:XP_009520919.1 hypothetical protein PHYSODRAFT_326621 [Phytophthora sojae]
MADDQAAIEAAKAGDAKWLCGLVDVNDNSVGDAIVEASTRGHVDCVEVLVAEYATRDLTENYSSWADLLEAFETAAANGHLEVLRLLLTEIRSQPDAQRKVELRFTTNQALLAAADRGHLDVVKFVVHYAKEESNKNVLRGSHALARAISGGQAAVVEYLLGVDEFTWELQAAFVAAVGARDRFLADRIYQLYVQSSTKERLFVSLAAVGQLYALKYLYEAGHNGPELVGAAFVQASETLTNSMETDMLEFLLDTGRVSPDAFDKGLEVAVESTWDDVKATAYLGEEASVCKGD